MQIKDMNLEQLILVKKELDKYLKKQDFCANCSSTDLDYLAKRYSTYLNQDTDVIECNRCGQVHGGMRGSTLTQRYIKNKH